MTNPRLQIGRFSIQNCPNLPYNIQGMSSLGSLTIPPFAPQIPQSSSRKWDPEFPRRVRPDMANNLSSF